MFEAKGQYREAEAAYRAAEEGKRSHIRTASRSATVAASTSDLMDQDAGVDELVARQGRMKAMQGRLVEAEIDVRRALLGRLNVAGKHTPTTAWFIEQLVFVLAEQGRYQDAESLVRVALQIKRDLGSPENSMPVASSLNQLARLTDIRATRQGYSGLAREDARHLRAQQ